MGVKGIWLYGEGDDSDGYIVLYKGTINKLLNKVDDYLRSLDQTLNKKK
jgi:hypothetical protein